MKKLTKRQKTALDKILSTEKKICYTGLLCTVDVYYAQSGRVIFKQGNQHRAYDADKLGLLVDTPEYLLLLTETQLKNAKERIYI